MSPKENELGQGITSAASGNTKLPPNLGFPAPDAGQSVAEPHETAAHCAPAMNLRAPRWRSGRAIFLGLLSFLLVGLILGYPIARFGWNLTRWKASIWVMDYLTHSNPDQIIPDNQKHLIFVFVDHYEPGKGEKAAQFNAVWCDKFRLISNANRDDYGNRFRYTWFYPYDHQNEAVMQALARMAYEGFGEIEMHWHLTKADGLTNETFGVELDKAIKWYQQFGAMVTADTPARTAFAYIAGNWDLDASRNDVETHGITNQIDELVKHGCFADFTFSTIGTDSQPSKVNSIYYAQDDPNQPKSYNDGENVAVGKTSTGRLMIFQGPMTLELTGNLEYGAVERNIRFHPRRVQKWIDANIHVIGKPEWIFVKLYSHGAQSAKVCLDHDMDIMLKSLASQCRERGIKLHFMTAREAYNIVKAAEKGETGDPEDYRNYDIPVYRNAIDESVFSREANPTSSETAACGGYDYPTFLLWVRNWISEQPAATLN